MRARLLAFIGALREEGIPCSVNETLDATRAIATLGIERSVLREALAATLVKDRADRPVFDEVFARHFGTPHRSLKTPQRRAEDGEGSRGQGEGRGKGAPPNTDRDPRSERQYKEREPQPKSRDVAAYRELMVKPFEAMDARDVDALRDLAAVLGDRFRVRWSRRSRRANAGRVDMRRTIRRATTRGGVPLELLFRCPRPGKADLVALVDLSFSTATAANFLLALLSPVRRYFRRVVLLGYVDAISEVSFEHGYVIPHQALDLNARSDFGRVLTQVTDRSARMGRNTVLLILGDARNNRRAARADVLARLQKQCKAVVWLNPESRARWDTGDSVMSTYARYCSALINAWNVKTLIPALEALSRAAR